jgi:hypothetical protein
MSDILADIDTQQGSSGNYLRKRKIILALRPQPSGPLSGVFGKYRSAPEKLMVWPAIFVIFEISSLTGLEIKKPLTFVWKIRSLAEYV